MSPGGLRRGRESAPRVHASVFLGRRGRALASPRTCLLRGAQNSPRRDVFRDGSVSRYDQLFPGEGRELNAHLTAKGLKYIGCAFVQIHKRKRKKNTKYRRSAPWFFALVRRPWRASRDLILPWSPSLNVGSSRGIHSLP